MTHNMLLDGNTFEDSHSVVLREWVGDSKVGVALNWSRWQLASPTSGAPVSFRASRNMTSSARSRSQPGCNSTRAHLLDPSTPSY